MTKKVKKVNSEFKQLVGRVTWPTRFKVRQQKEDRLTKAWGQQADGNTPPPFVTRLPGGGGPLTSVITTASGASRFDRFDPTDILDELDDDGNLLPSSNVKVVYVSVD